MNGGDVEEWDEKREKEKSAKAIYDDYGERKQL